MSNENMMTFYRAILDTARITVDENDYLYHADEAGDSQPWLILDKHAVLPTAERLRTMLQDNTIAFQPLSENVLLGESEVIHAFRTELMKQVNMSVYLAMFCMANIALNPKAHGRVHPEFAGSVAKLKTFDEKSLTAMSAACETLMGSDEYGSDSFVVQMNLRNHGSIRVGDGEAEHHRRRALIDFPLMKALQEDQEEPGKVLGKKHRNSKRAGAINDYDLIEQVFLTIVPHARTANYYSAGSKDGLAPNLAAVLTAVQKIMEPVNSFIETNHKVVEGMDEMLAGVLPMEWVGITDDLTVFRAEVAAMPSLEGNGGTIKLIDKLKASRNIDDSIKAQAPAPTPPAPAQGSLPLPTLQGATELPMPFAGITLQQQQPHQQVPASGITASSLFGSDTNQFTQQQQQQSMMTAQSIRDAVSRGELTHSQGEFAMNQLKAQMTNPQQFNVAAYLSDVRFMQYLQQTNMSLAQALQMNSMNYQQFLQTNAQAMQALNTVIASFNQAAGIGQVVVGLPVPQQQQQNNGLSFAFAPTGTETIGAPVAPQGQQFGMPSYSGYAGVSVSNLL